MSASRAARAAALLLKSAELQAHQVAQLLAAPALQRQRAGRAGLAPQVLQNGLQRARLGRVAELRQAVQVGAHILHRWQWCCLFDCQNARAEAARKPQPRRTWGLALPSSSHSCAPSSSSSDT